MLQDQQTNNINHQVGFITSNKLSLYAVSPITATPIQSTPQ